MLVEVVRDGLEARGVEPDERAHVRHLVVAHEVDREAPEALAAADVRAPFCVQTSTIGGSSETLVNELAAMPQYLPSPEAVMIVTPVG